MNSVNTMQAPLTTATPEAGFSCLVLGVGNTLLKDDGIGIHAIEGIAQRHVRGQRKNAKHRRCLYNSSCKLNY